MFRDQFEDQVEAIRDEELKAVVFATPTDGYLPDEDDPAWPSRSGQAD